jgi:hypothetical protein
VAVQVLIPDEHGVETPVAGLRVTFLPFDRDSVLAALEAAAPPRPSTDALDSLFQAFREPFNGFLRASASLERLRRRLDQAPTPALRDSAARLEREVEVARAALARARAELQPGIDSLRRVMAAWEDTAFGTYDSLAGTLTRRRAAVADSTGADGWVTVTLRPGRWWVTARAFNVLDPYAAWYWNLPVDADTLRLSPATGALRPRYR